LVTPPEPFTQLETMAAHYIQEMRTQQPTGPYYLGGYCFGGIIAYEMARQLHENGEKIALLALLESVPLNAGPVARSSPAFVRHFFGALPFWFIWIWSLGPAEMGRRIKLKLASSKKRLRNLFGATKAKYDLDEGLNARLGELVDMSQYPADFKRYAEMHWKAFASYFPKKYPGRLTLFRTRQPRLFSFNPEVIWNRLALEGVQVELVPGRHDQILEEPYVQALAEALKNSLQKAHQTENIPKKSNDK
ncbi:MAG: thioesterase domain-containing protein, partial [Limisphaerales bacterium]